MTQLQIECFLTTVRTGSFSAAARELYLSVQSVSQHIQNLERDLSVHLFERSSEGASLTTEGQDFLAFSSRLAGLFTQTLSAIEEEYRILPQQFSIGLSEYIDAVGPITESLTSFARAHPDVELRGTQYTNRTLLSAVADGVIDAAILSSSQLSAGGELDVFPFAEEKLCLYISHMPELPERCTLEQALTLCRDLPHMDTSYGPWSRTEWEEISRRMNDRLGIQGARRCVLTNFRSVIASLRHTPCAAVCDARFGLLRDEPYLRSFPLRMKARLCVVSDKKNENPLLRVFREHMKQYYAK